MTANDIGPFQTLTAVSWQTISRYAVIELYSNSGDAVAGTFPPVLPTTASMVVGLMGVEYTSSLVFSSAIPDGITANDTADADKVNLDAINTIKKRKKIIDDSTSYWLVTIQAWSDGTTVHQAQIGYIFMLGRYVLDHPSVSHFFFDASSIGGSGEDITWDRPLAKVPSPCRDWSLGLLDLDDAPFPVTH